MSDLTPQAEPDAPVPAEVSPRMATPAPMPPPAASAPPAAPRAAPPKAAAQPSRSARAVLTALGFVLLLAGLGYEWRTQQDLAQQVASLAQQPSPPAPPPGVDPARVTGLEGRLKDLEARLAALQQRPAPAAAAAAAPVNLAPLDARVSALEARGIGDLNALTEKVAALAARLKALEDGEAALAERATRVLGYERAQLALEAGEPLGDIPGASPALARFAHAKPPTEAALRLAFPAAADAAEAASRPSGEGKAIAERMWLKVRSLVTVKQGNTVLLGPPSAAVLGTAHAKLEAGDLGGAVAALSGLDAAAAAAIADWRSAAQALLDARAALAAAAKS